MKVYLIRHAKTKEDENNIHHNDDVSIIKELVDPKLYSNYTVSFSLERDTLVMRTRRV